MTSPRGLLCEPGGGGRGRGGNERRHAGSTDLRKRAGEEVWSTHSDRERISSQKHYPHCLTPLSYGHSLVLIGKFSTRATDDTIEAESGILPW